jgi:RHS repeat-associated protein
LVQVNLLGTAEVQADGRLLIVPAENKKLGDLVCRYAYDAMGRLMWKQTPINVGLTQLQRKDYYYDGVRRIQEVITRPRQIIEELPEEALDLGTGEGNDESPVQMRGGSPPPQEIDLEPVPPPTVNEQWTDREYVYGPGYVDEFILQIDRLGRAMYMLQDANYNVVALLDASGALLEQYAYDPYGTVVAADNLDEGGATAHAINRVGFQGLFFERYDGDYTQPCIAPNVAGMYYARARFYSPALGRFLQRDPNETGIPIIAALAMNGEAAETLFGGFDAQGLFGDGMNLYLFAGGNPVNSRDPSGLDTYASLMTAVAGLNTLQAAGLATAITAGVIAAAWALAEATDIVLGRGREYECRCTADDMDDRLRELRGGPCPDRVHGWGTTIGNCQHNAILNAPLQCRGYYHHCGWVR